MLEATAEIAAPAAAPETSSQPSNLGVLTQETRELWNKGEVSPKTSEDPSKTADSATAETPSDIAPAAEPGTSTQEKTAKGKTKEDSEKRWKELSEEKGNLQRRVDELERQLSAPRDKQASQPVAEKPKVEASKRPSYYDNDPRTGKPYDDLDKFHEDLAKWTRDDVLREIDGRQTKAQQAQQEAKLAESRKILFDKFQERAAETRKKLADFDEVALKTALPIREGSVADAFLMESAHGPEVLYSLAKDVPQIEAIQKLNPIAQARELFKLELLHGGLDELKKDSRFAELLTPPAIPVTKAPKPPSEVGGRGTTPNDPAEAAVRAGDFRTAKAEWTRRVMAGQ